MSSYRWPERPYRGDYTTAKAKDQPNCGTCQGNLRLERTGVFVNCASVTYSLGMIFIETPVFTKLIEQLLAHDDDDLMMWAGLDHLYLTSLPVRQCHAEVSSAA